MKESTVLELAKETEAFEPHSLSRRHIWLVLLPMFLVAVCVAAFWHFVSFAFTSNPVLNGLIASVMLWGAMTMLGHVRRIYMEERVFKSGISWMVRGVWSEEPNPKFGPEAFVKGMLSRLETLGLGHQVYVHATVMEPEMDALTDYFEKKQELSQFLVGLMVALGLLGTFVGLLETLVKTSDLIASISQSVGGGGNIEKDFVRIVGGLREPLSAMGTAFSASMFGLIGSIMLGFQMIVVRKASSEFVDLVREDVLSLAEKTKVSTNVEITERFLATLLSDILEQHQETGQHLRSTTALLSSLVEQVNQSTEVSKALALRLGANEVRLEKTADAVAEVSQLIPATGQVAQLTTEVIRETGRANQRMEQLMAHLAEHALSVEEVKKAVSQVDLLKQEMAGMKIQTEELLREVRAQGLLSKRMDVQLSELQGQVNDLSTPDLMG